MSTNQTFLISLVTLVGLILLVALHDVGATVAVPIIAGLTGVHIGATVSNTSST